MMGKVLSGALIGISGTAVTVEADMGNGLPSFDMVGYLGGEVREARERVRTAIKNSGFLLPAGRLTVNLSPADLKKQGNGFDLAIAIAILTSCGILTQKMVDGYVFSGELGLDGSLRPVNGALILAECGKEEGVDRIFLPKENAGEAACCEKVKAIGASSLIEVIHLLKYPEEICYAVETQSPVSRNQPDFADMKGQKAVKRATEIAAAGMHNILYIGSPGSGKTMAAGRIPSILPPMTKNEQLELTKIYSVCGLIPPGGGLLRERPYRNPHHSVSAHALVGGGTVPKPGEISLADRGVLFLDELPEFQKQVLEMLRQPLEDRQIVINRIHGSYLFPAHFMLAAAMNPCPCGYYPDRSRCRCSKLEVDRYLSRISQPLLDRIDICVEAGAITYSELTRQEKEESSQEIRDRVIKACEIQKKRFSEENFQFNSQIPASKIRQYCRLGEKEEDLMKNVFEKMGLSIRAHHRILKTARTIADLEGSESINSAHLSEAVSYRNIDKKYWGM